MKLGGTSMQILPTVTRYMRLNKPGHNVMQLWQFQVLPNAWTMIYHFPDAGLTSLEL